MAAAAEDGQHGGANQQGEPHSRRLSLIHFNDVYNINAATQEPVGGAARFVAALKSQAAAAAAWANGAPPLAFFSGDAFSPSLMSVSTLGRQMVPVLNACGLAAACVGNHDFDFGLNNFVSLSQECNFPWLMANVLDAATGQPLGGAGRSLLLQHASGVNVGVIGLVEGDWVETLSTIEPDDVTYLDFVTEGRRLAQELRASGAELVVALTHMRQPNDILLCQQVPEIDVVLGGHDHFYAVEVLHPHGSLLAKSGTDFREFTRIDIALPPAAGSAGQQQQQQQAAAHDAATTTSSSSTRPWSHTWRHIQITSDLPEDPEIAQVVQRYSAKLGALMDQQLVVSASELDGRFTTVRTRESALGSLLCDIFRAACGADACLMNSGTFRSDVVHPPGPLTYRDLVSILPMMDETCVLRVRGAQLLAALENGVSMWPRQEGRFPQVSGIRFAFDPSLPPGARVVPGSVTVGAAPLDPQATVSLATKEYLAEGRDGYDCLEGCQMVMDGETTPMLQTAARQLFLMMEVLNRMHDKTEQPAARVARHWAARVAAHCQHPDHDHRKHEQHEQQQHQGAPAGASAVTAVCVRDGSGSLVLAAPTPGRITIVGDAAAGAVPS